MFAVDIIETVDIADWGRSKAVLFLRLAIIVSFNEGRLLEGARVRVVESAFVGLVLVVVMASKPGQAGCCINCFWAAGLRECRTL